MRTLHSKNVKLQPEETRPDEPNPESDEDDSRAPEEDQSTEQDRDNSETDENTGGNNICEMIETETDCSVPCGYGVQNKTTHPPDKCPGETFTEEVSCNREPCPRLSLLTINFSTICTPTHSMSPSA